MRLLLVAALVACCSLSGALRLPAAADAQRHVPGLRTPSGNIVCAFSGGSIRCDIRSGLHRLPPRPRDCDVDWGQGFTLRKRGRAAIVCAGDTVLALDVPTLRYGRTWRRGGITCVSRSVGLRCHNADGRGFFLSRERAFRF
jgi:hypothetical protein